MKFIARSPVRISLCNGGDTDYYVNQLGWSNLINATLRGRNYFCEIEQKNQDHIDYFYINTFSNTNFKKEIQSLETKEENLKLITETVKEIMPSFRGSIKIIANVPEKSGLGGSSSLVVSLVKALTKLSRKENILPEDIARSAYKIEREIVGIKGGYQDQWAAAFAGGVNYLEFRKNHSIFLEPLWLSEKLMKQLEENLILFFIEPRRGDSGNVHKELESKVKKKKKEDHETMLLKRENVLKTRDALLKGDMKLFGDLLNNEQLIKAKLYNSLLTEKSTQVYDFALKNGATAGKISGAGSGGCAFFVYPKKDKSRFIKKMTSLGCKHIPLKLQRLNTMGEI